MYGEFKESDKDDADEVDSQFWLQRVIIIALKIGISKKELFEDYYFDEIGIIFSQYHSRSEAGEENGPEIVEIGAEEFFGF